MIAVFSLLFPFPSTLTSLPVLRKASAPRQTLQAATSAQNTVTA